MSWTGRRAVMIGVLAVALAGPVPAIAGPAPASQAPVISQVTVTPSPVDLAPGGGTTPVQISMRVVDPDGIHRVAVGLYDRKDKAGLAFRLSRSSGKITNGIWTVRAWLPNSARRGTWSVRAFAVDLGHRSSDPDQIYTRFRVRHATRILGIDVAPEPVAAGDKLTAVASLQRYRPGKGWLPLGGRMVQLQFRERKTTGFVTVAKTRSDKTGAISFTEVPATTTGAWRIVYPGGGSYQPSTSGKDAVAVRTG